jgi:hypothetical protein
MLLLVVDLDVHLGYWVIAVLPEVIFHFVTVKPVLGVPRFSMN